MPNEDEGLPWRLSWQVPDRGYLWADDLREPPGQEGGEWVSRPPYLVEGCEQGKPAPSARQVRAKKAKKARPPRSIAFHEYPADLFLEFARLEGREDILEFANRWGWLGVGRPAVQYPGGNTLVLAERLADWEAAIRRLKWASQVWRWIEDRDVGKLGQHFIWREIPGVRVTKRDKEGYPVAAALDPREGHTRVYFTAGDWVETLASGSPLDRDREPGRLLREWPRYDVIGPARYWLVRTINKELAGTVAPAMLLDAKAGAFRLHFAPVNLLALLWTQIFLAVTGQRRFRPCAICHRLMDVTENTRAKMVHPECSRRERHRRWREKRAAVAAPPAP